MKKISAILIAFVLIISLAACNGASGGDTTNAASDETTESTAQSNNPSDSESDSSQAEDTTKDYSDVFYNVPTLTVICGNYDVEADDLTFVWCWDNPDGTSGGNTTDGRHPLAIKEALATLAIAGEENRLLMAFDSMLMPEAVTVLAWHEDSEAGESGEPALKITLTDPENQTDLWGGYSFELLDGNYVYDIEVKWNKDTDGIWNQYGTVHYAFKTQKSQ